MRSRCPSPRRVDHPALSAPVPGRLAMLAELVDQATVNDRGHVLVHLAGPPDPDLALGLRPLEPGIHPFDVLAGFTAPAEWTAFGVRARGQARHLEDPKRPPSPTTVTFLAGRDGEEASLLRLADEVTTAPGSVTGTVPDVCRRVLGLATAPGPTSTAELWTCIWLDRVLDAWGQPQRRRALMTRWEQIAALHPAMASPDAADGHLPADPSELVAFAHAHAAAISWTDLRCAPASVPLPDRPLSQKVAGWMDDGFFARWTIGAFPGLATMAGDLRPLLGEPVGGLLAETVTMLVE